MSYVGLTLAVLIFFLSSVLADHAASRGNVGKLTLFVLFSIGAAIVAGALIVAQAIASSSGAS